MATLPNTPGNLPLNVGVGFLVTGDGVTTPQTLALDFPAIAAALAKLSMPVGSPVLPPVLPCLLPATFLTLLSKGLTASQVGECPIAFAAGTYQLSYTALVTGYDVGCKLLSTSGGADLPNTWNKLSTGSGKVNFVVATAGTYPLVVLANSGTVSLSAATLIQIA